MTNKWIKEELYCNIGNVKLYAIFERRYRRMWQENGGNCWRHVGASKYDFVVSKWCEYLNDMSLNLLKNKPETGEYIMNPILNDMGLNLLGANRNWPSYVSIPEEFALKILTLGELP